MRKGAKDGKRRSRMERGSKGDPKEEETDKNREESDGNLAEDKDGESGEQARVKPSAQEVGGAWCPTVSGLLGCWVDPRPGCP